MIATAPHWCLETQESGQILVIRFAGRQVRLGEQHLRLADEYLFGPGLDVGGREVVLDLENVACVASTALAWLVRLNEKIAAADGHLRLDAVSPHLHEVLEVTQLHRVLDVH
ncbi:MAG: STAS domain-containing protein [Gemmataceae bacterium]|nr:STAS domain-containing protein [Gemmataceae bacterium]